MGLRVMEKDWKLAVVLMGIFLTGKSLSRDAVKAGP